MAIAFVQSKIATSSSGSTIAATFTTTPTVGNLIVVAVCGIGSTITCADNKGNTYTAVAATSTCYVNAKGTPGFLRLFWCVPTTATATFTVTGTITTGNHTIAIHEYSGAAASSPVDVFDTTPTVSGLTSDSVTPSQDNSLIYGCMYSDDTGTGASTAGTGYTKRESVSGGGDGNMLITEDAIQGAATLVTTVFGAAAGSLCTPTIVVFKPAGAGGGGFLPRSRAGRQAVSRSVVI